jgi:hypothetical protein
MIPKGISHTSVTNSTYEVPKGTMETRFEPSLPRNFSMKKYYNFLPGFEPGTPASVESILTLDQQARYVDSPQSC